MIVVLLGALALVIVKSALLESFRVFGVFPDLVLVLVTYAALFLRPSRALAAGAFAGALCGLTTPGAASVFPALYGGAGWVAGRGWRQFIKESPAIEFLFLLPLGLAINTVVLALEFGPGGRLARGLAAEALPNALATAALGPLLFAAIKRYVAPLVGGLPQRAPRRRR